MLQSLDDLHKTAITICLSGFRGYSKGIFDNFATYIIHHAGKKNHSIFRSVNIITLLMQQKKGTGRFDHLRY